VPSEFSSAPFPPIYVDGLGFDGAGGVGGVGVGGNGAAVDVAGGAVLTGAVAVGCGTVTSGIFDVSGFPVIEALISGGVTGGGGVVGTTGLALIVPEGVFRGSVRLAISF